MYKLVKLNADQFVLIGNIAATKEDVVLHNGELVFRIKGAFEGNKIIASSKQILRLPLLKLSQCESIEGVTSTEDTFNHLFKDNMKGGDYSSFKSAYKTLYNKVILPLVLNKKDKLFSAEEMEAEIRKSFVHGQGNAQLMEAGLERDEIEDYVSSRMRSLTNNKNEWNVIVETETLKQPCSCGCHRNVGTMHIMACCNNGMIEINTNNPKITDNYINIIREVK